MTQPRASHNRLFGTTKQIRHILQRRRVLKSQFDIKTQLSALEESCIPSYCHGNWLAAYAAWWRLFTAVELANRFGNPQQILDFGAGCGELRHLLSENSCYNAVEEDKNIAEALKVLVPDANLIRDVNSYRESYDIIFALDCLEHNAEPNIIIKTLCEFLVNEGIFVLSGPTENFFYRAGRYISGFHGDYHTTNIYQINALAENHLKCVYSTQGPWHFPLFLISVWKCL